jgi:hypothetical protein
MTNIIYGVDADSEVTSLMVRDALSQCFYQAHCEDSGLGDGEEEINRNYCRDMVKKVFVDSGGDFEKPTKESILNAMSRLKDFSKSFRDPSIIEAHAAQIMKLVEKIK